MESRGEKIHRCISLMIDANRKHRHVLECKISDMGCFPTQHKMLGFIYRNGAVSQKEIAEEFNISYAAVAVSMQKMEKNGLIVRKTAEEDNRKNYVLLTEKGNLLVRQTKDMFDSADTEAFEGIDPDKLDVMIECLEKIKTNLSEMEIKNVKEKNR